MYDFVRVYAMEADAVQRKAYKGKVESVMSVLAKMPERMGGVMRGLVDDVLRVSPDGATGGATSDGLEVVERVEDIDEFQDELRRQKQANTAQLILQAFVIGSLIVRWFRDRNKGRKPKKPRTPPSGDS